MSDDHESSAHHPAQRNKSGEYDPIWEILSSQKKMQAQINDIKERLAAGDHAITSVRSLTEHSQSQRDRLTIMETQMKGIMWFAGVMGALSIGSVITAVAAVILKGHP